GLMSGLNRESGANPELSRSGKQERPPSRCTGSRSVGWEATASRKIFDACKSEDLSITALTRRTLTFMPSRLRLDAHQQIASNLFNDSPFRMLASVCSQRLR